MFKCLFQEFLGEACFFDVFFVGEEIFCGLFREEEGEGGVGAGSWWWFSQEFKRGHFVNQFSSRMKMEIRTRKRKKFKPRQSTRSRVSLAHLKMSGFTPS